MRKVKLRLVVGALGALMAAVAPTANTALHSPQPAKRRAVPPTRVTMITDSVGGVLYWADAARKEVAQGLDFRLETKACRKLVETGCLAYGERPPSALETIESLGAELGPLVVIDVGYNDRPDEYSAALDTIMHALLSVGVEHVIWVTLEETEQPWTEINAAIRAAPARWPQLAVADWAPVAAANPSWFVDLAHMNADGALGFARFMRPIILSVCGQPCVPPPPLPPAVAAMLPPTVGVHLAVLRWRGNDVARTYDVAVKLAGRAWRTVAWRLAATSYLLRGRPGERMQVRVRARDDADRAGPWSTPRPLRFRSV